MAPPCGLTKSASSLTPSWRRQAMPCEAKASLKPNKIKIANLQAEPLHQLARRRHRADAHDTRRHRGRGEAENFRPRRQAVPFHRSLRCKNHRGGAVIDARSI